MFHVKRCQPNSTVPVAAPAQRRVRHDGVNIQTKDADKEVTQETALFASRFDAGSNQYKSPQRLRDRHRFIPPPAFATSDFVEISPADPEHDLFRGDLLRRCPFQKLSELTDRPRARDV